MLVRVRTDERVAALTFDDGPDATFTPQVLDALAATGDCATFFVDGQAATRHPELIDRILREGHEIGLHGWSHTSAETAEMHGLVPQLREIHLAKKAVGRRVRFYRPPYGHESRWTRLAAALCRVRLVYWSASPGDWRVTTSEELAEGIRAALQPGSIVLMHDRLRTAVDPAGFDRGYMVHALRTARAESDLRSVTLSELQTYGNSVIRRRRHSHPPLAAMVEQAP